MMKKTKYKINILWHGIIMNTLPERYDSKYIAEINAEKFKKNAIIKIETEVMEENK